MLYITVCMLQIKHGLPALGRLSNNGAMECHGAREQELWDITHITNIDQQKCKKKRGGFMEFMVDL